MEIFAYDFDGVVSIGINPRNENDIIITGRCIDEKEYVLNELNKRNINCKVYFNPMTLSERGNHTIDSRIKSGMHKVSKIIDLIKNGNNITRFFEDDPIQFEILKEIDFAIELVFIQHHLVQK